MLTMTDNIVIMPTSIISSIILFNRYGGIKEDQLVKKSQWFINEIKARNVLICMNDNPSAKTIRTYLPLLKNEVKVKKDFIEIEFKS